MFIGPEGSLTGDQDEFANNDQDSDKDFDFEDYDDTDLNGAGFEMIIDELIQDADREVGKVLAGKPRLQRQARNEIGRLWIEKIRLWSDYAG